MLAVAVLGAAMTGTFAHSLHRFLRGLELNADIVRQLESNVAKLGSLSAPSEVDPRTAATIRSATSEAFIAGFRVIMLICAGLALASAVVAWRMIPAQPSLA